MNNKMFQDPIHGVIEIPDYCIKIIDTPYFQRLRNIKQLGCCYYVFPGATHNRFEHSIGVSYLAGELLRHLKNNQPELEIKDNIIKLVEIAGLCHDLGHGCYSHLFDYLTIPEIKKQLDIIHLKNEEHEKRSCMILDIMYQENRLPLDKDELEIVKDLILPRKYLIKEKWYYEIVCNCINGLDVDKFDYLCRDIYNLGLSYNIDSYRILKSVRVIDNHICYPKKLIFDLFDLFHIRYKLHNEVYNHPLVKCVEHMINDILIEYNKDTHDLSHGLLDISNFIEIDDTIINKIKYSSNNNNIQILLNNLNYRKLYKYIGEIHFDKDKYDIHNIKDIFDILKNKQYTKLMSDLKELYEKKEIILDLIYLGYDNTKFYKHIYFYNNKENKRIEIDRNEYEHILPSIKNIKLIFICRNTEYITILKNIYLQMKNIIYN